MLHKAGGCVTLLIQDVSVHELFEALIKEAGLENKIFLAISDQTIQKKLRPHQLILIEDSRITNNFL